MHARFVYDKIFYVIEDIWYNTNKSPFSRFHLDNKIKWFETS